MNSVKPLPFRRRDDALDAATRDFITTLAPKLPALAAGLCQIPNKRCDLGPRVFVFPV